MGSFVPFALAGAVVVLASSGKKRRRKSAPTGFSYQPIPKKSIPQVYGGTGIPTQNGQSATTWIQRQEALKTISQIEFNTSTGGTVTLCSKCDPAAIDGKAGKNTRNAIRAFQAIAGLDVSGQWSGDEDQAMHRILTAISKGLPIECDPLSGGYPSPFACFVYGDDYALMLQEGEVAQPKTEPTPSPDKPKTEPTGTRPREYGPDEWLVADADCNQILHQDMKWFEEQRIRMITSALEGMTDAQAAREIHESMLADTIPLCLSLGRSGVGPGVGKFWDTNLAHVAAELRGYEILPETLEEDAIKFGLL